MTYLVMECHPSYAIVLDNKGRMIKAANLGYQEGQVVGEIIARQIPKAPILFRLAPLAAAAWLYWEAGPMAHTECRMVQWR